MFYFSKHSAVSNDKAYGPTKLVYSASGMYIAQERRVILDYSHRSWPPTIHLQLTVEEETKYL